MYRARPPAAWRREAIASTGMWMVRCSRAVARCKIHPRLRCRRLEGWASNRVNCGIFVAKVVITAFKHEIEIYPCCFGGMSLMLRIGVWGRRLILPHNTPKYAKKSFTTSYFSLYRFITAYFSSYQVEMTLYYQILLFRPVAECRALCVGRTVNRCKHNFGFRPKYQRTGILADDDTKSYARYPQGLKRKVSVRGSRASFCRARSVPY